MQRQKRYGGLFLRVFFMGVLFCATTRAEAGEGKGILGADQIGIGPALGYVKPDDHTATLAYMVRVQGTLRTASFGFDLGFQTLGAQQFLGTTVTFRDYFMNLFIRHNFFHKAMIRPYIGFGAGMHLYTVQSGYVVASLQRGIGMYALTGVQVQLLSFLALFGEATYGIIYTDVREGHNEHFTQALFLTGAMLTF